MDSALAEFAEKGRGGSSVNTICAAKEFQRDHHHYFENGRIISGLCGGALSTSPIAALPDEDDGSGGPAGRYFTARMTTGRIGHQPMRSDHLSSARLFEQIQARRKAFDALTISTFEAPTAPASAAYGHTMDMEEVLPIPAVSGLYQCAGASIFHACEECFALRDAQCRRLLTVLLYGVTEGDRYGY